MGFVVNGVNQWNWYEIVEGFVGTAMICGFTYCLHRIRKAMHEAHHAETMAAHKRTHRHLGIGGEDE